jgi:hypothetical protein
MPRSEGGGCRAISQPETELQCVYVVLIFVPCRSCRISCVTVVLRHGGFASRWLCVTAVLRHSGFATPCIFRAAVVRLCQGLARRTSGCAVFTAAFASAALRVPHLRRHRRHGSRPAAGTLATLARAPPQPHPRLPSGGIEDLGCEVATAVQAASVDIVGVSGERAIEKAARLRKIVRGRFTLIEPSQTLKIEVPRVAVRR